MMSHAPEIKVCMDGFTGRCQAGDWSPDEPFLTEERARAAYVQHVFDSSHIPAEWGSILVEPDQRREQQDLHDVIRMLVSCTLTPIAGGDDRDHELVFDGDGDGWNEPFSETNDCICGDWQIHWVQIDPEQTGRPDSVDVALAWRKHVLDTWPEEEPDDDLPRLG